MHGDHRDVRERHETAQAELDRLRDEFSAMESRNQELNDRCEDLTLQMERHRSSANEQQVKLESDTSELHTKLQTAQRDLDHAREDARGVCLACAALSLLLCEYVLDELSNVE